MNRIRFLRVQKAMKQEELAKVIHVSQSSLSGYENERFEPDRKTLIELADFFGVSVDYLLGLDGSAASDGKWPERVPVYSRVNAEALREPCFRSVLYFLDFNPRWKPEGEYFGLLVSGDCMEPRILEGDAVIARRQDGVESGELAVVQIGRENAVVRRVLRHAGGLTLISYNPTCKVLSFTDREISELPVVILGKAVEFRGKC